MKKVVFNIVITIVAAIIIGFLFYLGYMDAQATPVDVSELLFGWLK